MKKGSYMKKLICGLLTAGLVLTGVSGENCGARGNSAAGDMVFDMIGQAAAYAATTEGRYEGRLALGNYHSAVITENGDLYCWGRNLYGQIGNGDFGKDENGKYEVVNCPTKVLRKVKSVSLGYYHSAAITENGDLYCWGRNLYGQIGNGDSGYDEAGYGKVVSTPTKVLSKVKSVSLGYYHSAAITENGDLYCWGLNSNGQIGTGDSGNDISTPTKVLGKVKAVSLGDDHSAAITENGDLYCWGSNTMGQIGNGTTKDVLKPEKVLSKVKSVCLGEWNSAAITENGDLYCWGNNECGQVGTGKGADVRIIATPTKVLTKVEKVSLGNGFCAAITKNGDLYGWGDSDHWVNQKWINIDDFVTKPMKLLSGVREVSLGFFTCAAIKENGDLYCWGYNGEGQVGNGKGGWEEDSPEIELAPTKILTDVVKVDCGMGRGHSAAITKNGSLYCWGENTYGQVGNGTVKDVFTTTKIMNLGTSKTTKLTTKNTTVKLSKKSYTYDGKAKKPSVKVLNSKGKKLDPKYYTLTYKNNKKVGKATVTIKFKGKYSGTIKATYTIKPKGTSIKTVSAKSKSFIVTWKKQATQTSGYQIQYATDQKFTKGKKTITVEGAKKTSGTIKNLKGKQKYYVRVRTYKTVNGKKYYSAWSKAKAVTTKG